MNRVLNEEVRANVEVGEEELYNEELEETLKDKKYKRVSGKGEVDQESEDDRNSEV